MNDYLKKYIEQNIDLLETDILDFVLNVSCNIDHIEELYFVLLDANIAIPEVVTYMVAIFDAHERYYNMTTVFENIIDDNGGGKDDSGPYGFLTGMSESELHKVFVAFKDIIKNMKSDDYYIYPETEKLFNL